jgi:hypothetical protein
VVLNAKKRLELPWRLEWRLYTEEWTERMVCLPHVSY